MRKCLLTLGFAALAAGCGSSDKCRRVRCDADRYCDPEDGVCRPIDPTGVPPDGGTSDAGVDAGASTCVPACTAPTAVCDSTTLRCVQCLSDADCTCPTPMCDRASRLCQAAPDAGFEPSFGETCADVRPVPLPPCASTVTFTVDTSSARDDAQGSCNATNGGEAVYRLRLSTSQDVTLTSDPAPGASSDPALYLRRADCETGPELGCQNQLGGPERLAFKSLPPGDYFLFVDAYGAAGGGRTEVTVSLAPPSGPGNETCALASDIAFPDAGTSTTFTVDTAGAGDEAVGSCNDVTGGPELVYRLTLPQPHDVRITARGVGATVDPVLYLRESPCPSGAELACDDQLFSPELLQRTSLPAGDYFLFVESYDVGGGGPTEVSVELLPPTPPPPNDLCTGARAISFPTGASTVRFVIDTAPGRDDYSGSCNPFEPQSPEAVYLLSLSATRQVTITTAAVDGGTADPVLYLRQAPCESGSELACDDQLPPTPESISRTLAPGDYFLFVEGYGTAGAGPTEVTVTLGP
ncbi:MAG: hypothetical protein ACOZIN_01500 [Myxococcota bacterium]